tara:strand:- start:178 stop:1380 length:1203 start_codon:yes stop_codon:yes gene_type:complete
LKNIVKIKKNKFCIWVSSFHPVFGGLQGATLEIAKFFSAFYDVYAITNKYPTSLLNREVFNNIKIYRYNFFKDFRLYLRIGRIDLFFAWIFYKPVTIIRLFFFFIKKKPKIVNLHFPDNQLLECAIFKFFFDFDLIVSFHGNEVERLLIKGKKTSTEFKLLRYLLDSSVGISCCSVYLMEKIKKIYPTIDDQKYFCLYNGVKKEFLEKMIYGEKDKIIFSIGRFDGVKGFDFLLDAFDEEWELKLFLAGGDIKDFLKLGLKPKTGLTILGSLVTEKVASYMSKAMISVIPSKQESFGIVVAEAICSGSPVVATNVGGIPEVIDLAKMNLNDTEKIIFDKWVKIVEPNADSIQDGIKSIINNNRVINNYMTIIPKIRSQFSWALRLKNFKSLIERVSVGTN